MYEGHVRGLLYIIDQTELFWTLWHLHKEIIPSRYCSKCGCVFYKRDHCLEEKAKDYRLSETDKLINFGNLAWFFVISDEIEGIEKYCIVLCFMY